MEYTADVFRIFDQDWALLTAGDRNSWNTMTIGWGGLGTLWRRPVCTVYVKPVRYTHEFMDRSGLFTVSFYTEKYRRALGLLGSRSGRDCDKVSMSGLTPKFLDGAVTFQEAEVTLVCRKLYRQDLDTAAMPADVVSDYYETEAPHTMYIGEVLQILR